MNNIEDKLTVSYSEKLEKSILASVFASPEQAMDICVSEGVSTEDFFLSSNGFLFECFLEMYNRKHPIDGMTVHEWFKSRGRLEQISEGAFIGEVAGSRVSLNALDHYVSELLQKSRSRKAQRAFLAALHELQERDHESDLVIRESQEKLDNILVGKEKTLVTIGEAARETIEKVKKIRSSGEKNGIETGFEEIDKATQGFLDGELVVIAATPGAGKTAWALNVMKNCCVDKNIPIGFISVEMNRSEIFNRFVSMDSSLATSVLRQPIQMTDAQMAQYESYQTYFDKWKLHMDDDSKMHPYKIKARARMLKRKYGIKALFVDYLTLIKIEGKKQMSDYENATEASHTLRETAKELEIPVIVLAQVNRKGAEAEKLDLFHLRGSGQIEQDAHFVCFLDANDSCHNQVDLTIKKARNCRTNLTVSFIFDGPTFKFIPKSRFIKVK